MKKIVVMCWLMSCCSLLHAQASPEAWTQASRKINGTVSEQSEYVDFVLLNQQQANPVHLFMAARNAMQAGRLEDAGFLFYAGQLRAKLDFFRAPSPPAQQAVGAMRRVLSELIDPPLLRDPVHYEHLVARLKAWDVMPLGAYSGPNVQPAQKTPEQVSAAALSIRQGLLDHFTQALTLFAVPGYHPALMTVQAYNLGPASPDKPPVSKAEFDNAMAVLRRIEKERGLSFAGNAAGG